MWHKVWWFVTSAKKKSHLQNCYVELGSTMYLHGINIHRREVTTEKRVDRSLLHWVCLNDMKMSPQFAQLLLQKQCWHRASPNVHTAPFLLPMTGLCPPALCLIPLPHSWPPHPPRLEFSNHLGDDLSIAARKTKFGFTNLSFFDWVEQVLKHWMCPMDSFTVS